MPKMPVRQSGFACSACGPFTKNSEWIQNGDIFINLN